MCVRARVALRRGGAGIYARREFSGGIYVRTGRCGLLELLRVGENRAVQLRVSFFSFWCGGGVAVE